MRIEGSMKIWWTLVVLMPVVLYASTTSPLPVEAQLKAQVAQLEMQIQQLQGQNTICSAQLVIANQSQIQQKQTEFRASIEKEVGCSLDWNVSPPVCKDK